MATIDYSKWSVQKLRMRVKLLDPTTDAQELASIEQILATRAAEFKSTGSTELRRPGRTYSYGVVKGSTIEEGVRTLSISLGAKGNITKTVSEKEYEHLASIQHPFFAKITTENRISGVTQYKDETGAVVFHGEDTDIPVGKEYAVTAWIEPLSKEDFELEKMLNS